MVAKDFEVHDLVWAKMKGYCFWPAKIAVPENGKSPNKKQHHHFVYFFGSKNYAWIQDENIEPHSEEMIVASASYKKKPKSLLDAIEEIKIESQKVVKKNKTPLKPKVEKESLLKKSSPIMNSSEKKAKTPGKTPIVKKERPIKSEKKAVKKRPIVEVTTDNTNECSPPPKVQKVDADYSDLLDTVPPNNAFTKVAVIHPFDDECNTNQSSGLLTRTKYFERPSTPPMDISSVSANLQAKKIKATTKRIGFLGLGMMGRGVVKNLLNSGHNVTIWNRTPEKCEDFINAGAQKGQTPADVIQNCDITFCCVSDPDAAKALVFGNCGILKGLEGSTHGTKGYVEMTSIDPVTSQEIAEAITDKGGRYLEAPISGSRQLAEEGSLLILGAGDRELFNDCETCFFALSKNAYYLSCNVGSGSKMNLILSMLMGTTYAALAEAMALLERCKLSKSNFLEILGLGPLSCPLLLEKGRDMISCKFTTNTALKHQQKDLNLALALGNSCEQPMLLTAAANELFKHAKLRRYSDHDVSAVLMGAKY